jgi:UDP-GlcNAc:undecaprenyl-phosphate GlcNAc-1-phosphate transferase
MLNYILAFLLAFTVTVVIVPIMGQISRRLGALDMPAARKIHSAPLPRLGGVAITAGFLLPFVLFFPMLRPFIALLGGVGVVFVLGLMDDVRGLHPGVKLAGQLLAAGLVLTGGIGIVALTNPFSEALIALDGLRIPMEVFGLKFNLIPLANAVSIIWIVGIINVVNFLDGMDGLAAGVVAITAGAIAAIIGFGIVPVAVNQSVSLMALMLAGACCGFLVYNWHPSSILMGDSGAYTIGLVLAVLAIYGSAKIGVGVLVLGVAIIDGVWAVSRRLLKGKSPFLADRGHIHHQLLDSGLNQRQVVGYLYGVAAAIGLAVIFGNGYAGFAVLLLALVLTVSMVRLRQRKQA